MQTLAVVACCHGFVTGFLDGHRLSPSGGVRKPRRILLPNPSIYETRGGPCPQDYTEDHGSLASGGLLSRPRGAALLVAVEGTYRKRCAR